MSSPDLFVVCKSCGSEVSPYITECPYCGNRVRKRAPKLEKGGTPKPPKPSRRQAAAQRLPKLRQGEIPGVRVDRGGRAYATMAIVLAAVVVNALALAGVIGIGDLVLFDPAVGDEWWKLVTTAFVHSRTGYEVLALAGVALFGWLLERRHGPLAVVLVFVAATAAGAAVALALDDLPVGGAGPAAIGLLCAWVVPDLQDRRKGRQVETDLALVAVLACVLLALPIVALDARPESVVVGAGVGLLLGLPLAALHRRAS